MTKEREKEVSKQRAESREDKAVNTYYEKQARREQYAANMAYGFKLSWTEVDGGLTHTKGGR